MKFVLFTIRSWQTISLLEKNKLLRDVCSQNTRSRVFFSGCRWSGVGLIENVRAVFLVQSAPESYDIFEKVGSQKIYFWFGQIVL